MTGPLATSFALAAVAALVGLTWRPGRRSAFWFGLAAIGQGASLSMIAAGTLPRYQHYLPIAELVRDHLGLVAIMVAQAIVVIAALIRSGLVATLLRHPAVGPWRLGLAIALAVATSATVSADVTRYATELAVASAWQLLGLATIALAAKAWPERAGVLREWPARARPWHAAVLAVGISLALTLWSYERHPHIPDEVAYLHHAKYLAAGQLSMPAPPVPAAFEVDLMEYEPDRWYSPMPPGWSAALAAAMVAGLTWFLNPILTGLNVLLINRFIRRLYDDRVALAVAWLLALSPWSLSLGMSLMNHQLSLVCVLVAGLGVVNSRATGRWSWALLAGLAVGIVSLIRPLEGAIVGVLIVVWAIGVGGTRLRPASLAALAAGVLVAGGLVMPYNRALTGDPLTFPVNAYFSKHYTPNANAYGFGPDRGVGWEIDPNPGHSLLDGLINANLNTFGINTDLFGWISGSLILVTWFVCCGRWQQPDRVLAAAVVGIGLAYLPYYFSGGPDFGARYWFPVIVPLVALAVRGAQSIEALAGPRVWAAVFMLTLMTVVTYVPWRAADKYYQYRGMRPGIRQLASTHGFGADLVLVRGSRFPDYASAFVENPVDLRAPVTIYAWDRDPDVRRAVVQAYAGRRIWLVDGPTITGEGFRLVAGPLDAAAVLAGGAR